MINESSSTNYILIIQRYSLTACTPKKPNETKTFGKMLWPESTPNYCTSNEKLLNFSLLAAAAAVMVTVTIIQTERKRWLPLAFVVLLGFQHTFWCRFDWQKARARARERKSIDLICLLSVIIQADKSVERPHNLEEHTNFANQNEPENGRTNV